MAESKEEEEVWVQPMNDCRPSIKAPQEYSEEDAANDAAALRKGMKGWGTNEDALINIIGKRTMAQRQMIRQAFVTVDDDERDLIKDLKSELSGNLEKMAVGLMLTQGEYDAKCLHKACKGMGTDEKTVTEIICTRTWDEINNMKAAWPGITGEENDLATTIEGETSGTYQWILTTLLSREREPNVAVDDNAVKQDAEAINRLIEQNSVSEAKNGLKEIFTKRSWRHIGAVYNHFSMISRKYNLSTAISKAFGEGSDSGRCLRTIAEFSVQPYDFWALKLKEAMKGAGTSDEKLIRILVSRADVDLASVSNVFGQRHGDGKTLYDWLAQDLSGDYEKLALAVCDTTGVRPALNAGGQQQPNIVPWTKYFIVNGGSGKCIHVQAGDDSNGAKITQWEKLDDDNLKWFINPVYGDPGYFHLVSARTGRVLHNDGASNDNGAAITTWQFCPDPNLRIRFEPVTNPEFQDFWFLVFKHSDKCVHNDGNSQDNDGPITQWEKVDEPNLYWRLERCN